MESIVPKRIASRLPLGVGSKCRVCAMEEGGYLARIAAGDNPGEAAAFAARVAAAVIGHPGALISRDVLDI